MAVGLFLPYGRVHFVLDAEEVVVALEAVQLFAEVDVLAHQGVVLDACLFAFLLDLLDPRVDASLPGGWGKDGEGQGVEPEDAAGQAMAYRRHMHSLSDGIKRQAASMSCSVPVREGWVAEAAAVLSRVYRRSSRYRRCRSYQRITSA